MKPLFIALFGCMLAACSSSKNESSSEPLFVAEDFTAENLFTHNIEGPAFDNAGNLYVVNFQNDGTIGQVDTAGNVSLFLTLPEGSTANSIKFDSNGDMFLADFTGHNVLKVDMKSKEVSVHSHEAFSQPNDLCINHKDQLFASDPNWQESTGRVWRIDPDGKAVVLADSMGTTNGICLSPDEKVLYVNESVQRNIWAFDVDDEGNLSNKRLLISFPDFGFDGMKCDHDGNVYAARYDKGVIAVISSEGKLIREVQLKGKKCSNLVFGGPEHKTVFVTLQDRMGMEKFLNDVAGK